MTPPRVVLDACVLYPPLLRTVLAGVAKAGLIHPIWSRRILDEWLIATARKAPERLAAAEADRAALVTNHPEAMVEPAEDLSIPQNLPDPADAHVIAAAEMAGAGIILTFNLGDFPKRLLASLGIEARHPDNLLWQLWSEDPDAMEAVLTTALPTLTPSERRGPLKRARLPRLGKAQIP